MKTIKFTNLNLENFLAFIANADIGNNPHCIDLSNTTVYCKAAPEDFRFVKYTSILTKDIISFADYPDDVPSLILKFVKLSKLRDPLKAFIAAGQTTIDGEITYDQNKKGEHLVNHMRLKSVGKKMNIMVRCDAAGMIQYIATSDWQRYCNRKDVLMRFDVDAAFLKQLDNMMKLDNQNAITLDSNKGGLIVRSVPTEDGAGVWDMDFDGANHFHAEDIPLTISIPKNIFENIVNKNYYTINIVRNYDAQKMERLICVLYHDDDNIIIANVSRETRK